MHGRKLKSTMNHKEESEWRLPACPKVTSTGVNISDSEKLMSFYVSISKSPSNLFVYDFESKEVKQLTNTMTKEIEPGDLVAGEVIRYKSFDCMEIPPLLYSPQEIPSEQKVPSLS